MTTIIRDNKNKSTNNSYKSNQSQLISGKGSKRSQPKSGNDNLEPQSKYVDVYNLMGQKVASQMLREDVETLPAGLYIINGKKIYVK